MPRISIATLIWKCLGAWCAVLGMSGIGPFALADPPAAAVPGATASAPAIDEWAMAVLKKVETTMVRLKTYRAECWTTIKYDPGPDGKSRPNNYEMATLVAAKPIFMRYERWDMKSDAQGKLSKISDSPKSIFACDGKTCWKQFGKEYHTDRRMAPREMTTMVEPWIGFYASSSSPYSEAQESLATAGSLLEVRDDGTETVDGVVCNKVFEHIKTDFEGTIVENRTTWFISADGLVRRKIDAITFDGKRGYTRDATLRTIEINKPIGSDLASFTYTPAKDVERGVDFGVPKEPVKSLPLLANGIAAPDFTAIDRDGKSIKLSSLKGRVVVVDFWASWCAPCKASMPHNQQVAHKLQAEGLPVVFLAVDNGEVHGYFTEWIKSHPELDALRFAYVDPRTLDVSGKLYQVPGIPTQYVIDRAGVIRASFVGFDGPNDDLENAVRAAMKSH